MAFSAVTALGVAGVDTGGGNPVITLTAAAEAGRLVFVLIAKDNVGTTADNAIEITGITDSAGGNNWKSAHRWKSALAANAGAYVDLWYCVLTNAIALGGTITVQKSSDVDCAITAYKVTKGAGTIVTVVGLNQENTALDPGSIATSGLSNVEHLHVRAIASESETATGPTATSTWSAIAGTISSTAGASAANMRVAGEYKISTSTGETSDPTLFAADQASILVAFAEISNPTGEALLLHCDGADASTTFTDSARAHSVSAQVSAQIDTAQKVFGTGSALLNNGYLNLDGSTDFSFVGDFTIDTRYRTTNNTTLQYLYGGGNNGIFIFVQNDSKLYFWINGRQFGGTTTFTTNADHHVAATRSGSTIRLFLDGTQEGADFTDDTVVVNSAGLPRIGAHSAGGGNVFDRWMDEIHVVNGQALWTANFTPPPYAYGSFNELTSTSLATGQPVLGSPPFAQVHILASQALAPAGLPALGEPVFTQVQALLATGLLIESPPVFGEPELSTVIPPVDLVALDLVGIPPDFGAPSVAQTHGLIGENLISSGPALSDAALTQQQILTALTLEPAVGYEPGVPVFTQVQALIAESLTTSSPEFGEPTILQAQPLVALELVIGSPTFGEPPLTQTQILTAEILTTGPPAFGEPPLTQEQALVALSLAPEESPEFGAPSVSTTNALVAASLIVAESPVFGTPALLQVQIFTADLFAVGVPDLGQPVLAQEQVLTADSLIVGSPTFGEPALTQAQIFTADSLTVGAPDISQSTLTQEQIFAADQLTVGSPELGQPVLTQEQILEASSLDAASPVLDQPVFTQIQALVARRYEAYSPYLESVPAFTVQGENAIFADALVIGSPTFGEPSITQEQVLVASSLDAGSPDLGQPQLSQLGDIIPESLSVGAPDLGQPLMTQLQVLVAASLEAGAPELLEPLLNQQHQLVADALLTTAPVLGDGVIAQTQILSAFELTAPSPILGDAALAQKHALSALLFETSSPVLTDPTIVQTQALSAAELVASSVVLGEPTLAIKAVLFMGPEALDLGLAAFGSANKIIVCSEQPKSWAEAGTYKIGECDFGIGNAFTEPAAASPNGRKITSSAIVAGTVTAEGTPSFWAALDENNSRMLASGPMDGGMLVTTSDGFGLPSFVIHVPVETV